MSVSLSHLLLFSYFVVRDYLMCLYEPSFLSLQPNTIENQAITSINRIIEQVLGIEDQEMGKSSLTSLCEIRVSQKYFIRTDLHIFMKNCRLLLRLK